MHHPLALWPVNGWRIAGWGSLAALCALPALAMQLTREVDWTAGDFLLAALLLGFVGTTVELAARFAPSTVARAGYILAGATAFLTLWSNAAVGILGEAARLNASFGLMIVAAILATLLCRFRPAALRWIALALAAGQYGVGLAARSVMPVRPVEWLALTLFALAWVVVAACFARAARTG